MGFFYGINEERFESFLNHAWRRMVVWASKQRRNSMRSKHTPGIEKIKK